MDAASIAISRSVDEGRITITISLPLLEAETASKIVELFARHAIDLPPALRTSLLSSARKL